ncbi:MAG: MFS transporter [Pseudomonadota bacterium]
MPIIEETEITIIETIDDVPSTPMWRRWLVVMTASLLFFYTFLQLNMFNTISGNLMRDFAINATKFSELSALYFYGNFFLLFPAGVLLDRFSTRHLILLAMSIAIVTMFGFAFSYSIFWLSINRFFSGITGAFAFLSAIRLASRWFDAKHMALASGFIITIAMIGGMIAQTPVEILSNANGWRTTIMSMGWLGIAIFILMFFVIHNWPAEATTKQYENELRRTGFWKSIQMVVFNRYNWLGGAYTALMNLPIVLLGALWGSMYLVNAEHISPTQASYVITMIFLGTIVGSPFVGWISDRLETRVLPMAGGALLSLITILIIIFIPHLSMMTLLTLFFLLGLLTSAQVLSYPTIAELNSPLLTGSAISVISLVIMASGFIFQPVFGWLLDLQWKHILIKKIPIYSIQDFHHALIIMPIAFVASIGVAFLLKETNCRSQITMDDIL